MATNKKRNVKKPKAKKLKREKAKKPKAKKLKREKAKKPKAKKLKREKAKTRKVKKTRAKTPKRKRPSRVETHVKKPPRGFIDVAKKKEPEDAYGDIKDRLESTRDALAAMDIDSRVRIHRYRDESIDGELLVKVPHGVATDNLVLDIEEAMGRKGMPGFWINMGTRFTIKEDDEVYRRFRGYNDVNTHYQAAVPANWSEIPLIVRRIIVAGMENKYGRKADSVYLRIHWSPDGAKPKSRG